MRAIYLTKHFQNADKIHLSVVERPKPRVKRGYCLVRVHSSGVNQSDAKGTLGFFDHAELPRIPGRDFAGIVVAGKGNGKRVWGSGGAAGIDGDGTHAEFILVPEKALAVVPKNLGLVEAGAQVLPYLTAYYGLCHRARVKKEDRVLVMGALGQVGQAAMSICRWKGCKAVAFVKESSVERAQGMGWEVTSRIRGHYDVILNPLGSIFWEESLNVLNRFGRMVVIGAGPDPKVDLKLLPLYRANQEILGINTVDLGFVENARLLSEMKRGFETGALVPLNADAVYPLEKATDAYRAVLKEGSQRIVLSF